MYQIILTKVLKLELRYRNYSSVSCTRFKHCLKNSNGTSTFHVWQTRLLFIISPVSSTAKINHHIFEEQCSFSTVPRIPLRSIYLNKTWFKTIIFSHIPYRNAWGACRTIRFSFYKDPWSLNKMPRWFKQEQSST